MRLSSDLSFSLQIKKVITTASQMVGWGLRTFRGGSSHLMITIFRSLVQPHLDYCSQLWCPTTQGPINRIEAVQKSLISRIKDPHLQGLSYWQKLMALGTYSQERRRERYRIIFIWKVSQGLVSGYDITFTPTGSQTGRKAVPAQVCRSSPASVRQAREGLNCSISSKAASGTATMETSICLKIIWIFTFKILRMSQQ